MVQIRVVPSLFRPVQGPTGRRLSSRGIPVRAYKAVTRCCAGLRRGRAACHQSPIKASQFRRIAQDAGSERRAAADGSSETDSSRPPNRLRDTVLYNERREQVPGIVGPQFRCFRRAEMDRQDAERTINELFTSVYSATVRYAASKCGSLDLAEDLVQEAFGALYARLREGAVIQDPRAWVMKAVQNQICKAWRKAENRPERVVSRHEIEAIASPSDGLGGFVDPDRPHLEGFLAGLAPREREVILLRAQGLKYREIASRLGISSSSVGTLLLRAARKMRVARAETILSSVRDPARSS